jgi:hypothetical protein
MLKRTSSVTFEEGGKLFFDFYNARRVDRMRRDAWEYASGKIDSGVRRLTRDEHTGRDDAEDA